MRVKQRACMVAAENVALNHGVDDKDNNITSLMVRTFRCGKRQIAVCASVGERLQRF